MMACLVATCLSWLVGCSPSNMEDCRAAAAKMPTDRGVNVAIADCTEKFVSKPMEEKRATDEARQAKNWAKLSSSQWAGSTLDSATALLGQPSGKGEIHACTDDNGKPLQESCQFVEWESFKKGEPCIKSAYTYASVLDVGRAYRAEFSLPNGRIQRYHVESISKCNNAIE